MYFSYIYISHICYCFVCHAFIFVNCKQTKHAQKDIYIITIQTNIKIHRLYNKRTWVVLSPSVSAICLPPLGSLGKIPVYFLHFSCFVLHAFIIQIWLHVFIILYFIIYLYIHQWFYTFCIFLDLVTLNNSKTCTTSI